MDWVGLIITLGPMVAVGVVCVVAFRRRHRLRTSLIVYPYTLAIEPDSSVLGTMPDRPTTPITASSSR